MNGTEVHSYRLFGLSVASEIFLPELAATRPVSFPDVVISIGQGGPASSSAGLTIADGKASLAIEGVASYDIVGGTTIVVTPAPEVSERNIRLYLLGSAFAAILHQRALLPLHSNAIVIDGHAVAFLGHAGAGKSTLAAWFYDRGLVLLSDDVCVVSQSDEGRFIAHAGVPRLRLWRDALEATGRSVDGQDQAFDDWDKYDLRAENGTSADAKPLSHLYLLSGKASAASNVGITRLSGSRAVRVLVENTYRGAYVKMMGSTKGHLEQCVKLAQNLAIFEVCRPWGLDVLDEVGTALEEHARSVLDARLAANLD